MTTTPKVRKRNLFYIIGALAISPVFLSGCYAPEPLSITPKISLSNLSFKEIEGNADQLILHLDFEDGDGDIGLEGNENNHPYHEYDIVRDSNAAIVTLNGTYPVAPFFVSTPAIFQPPSSNLSLFSTTDNRPEYNCQDYIVAYLSDDRTSFKRLEDFDSQNPDTSYTKDTIYIVLNKDRFNISIDFFRKVGEDYEYIDWTRAFGGNGCNPDFSARFPIFDEEGIGSSLEGTIKYTMRSLGFNLLLRQDVFKLRIMIQDRALNESNVIETNDVTLQDLLIEE